MVILTGLLSFIISGIMLRGLQHLAIAKLQGLNQTSLLGCAIAFVLAAIWCENSLFTSLFCCFMQQKGELIRLSLEQIVARAAATVCPFYGASGHAKNNVDNLLADIHASAVFQNASQNQSL